MKVATFNGCRVYNLSAGNTQPGWLSEAKKRKLAKDNEYRRRLELIQDFDMPARVSCMKITKDCEHIIACGGYPPIVKCYTTSDMSMKFQRGLTSDVIACESLSDNYGKMVFLQSDRSLNFHAPYGTHYSLRIPKFGRDLLYDWSSCDLFVAASSNELYRVNLSTGVFREPFDLSFEGCDCMGMNPVYNRLLACGGADATCQFFDTRSKKTVSTITVDSVASINDGPHGVSVSALKFDVDGFTLGVGTSNGYCILYDIRSSKPLYVKEHQYGLPMVDITFHNNNGTRHVLSTDKKIVKIWSREAPTLGKILTNVEAPADINCVNVVSDKRGQSGMIMVGGEQSKIMNYYIPQLGSAPRWCSFLENITEELEETTSSNLMLNTDDANNTVYEDYKFVTKVELEELGAVGLIGTPMLKGYMHGFFMEMKLYTKLRAVSKPFEYEEYRKRKINEKIDAKRESRISTSGRASKNVAVNKDLAERLMKLSKKTKKKDDEEGREEDETAPVDDRFSALFKRKEFEVDENTEDYLLRHPVKSAYQVEKEKTMKDKRKARGYDEEEDGLYEAAEDISEEVDSEDEGDEDSVNNYDEDDDINIRYASSDDENRPKKKRRSGKDDEEGEFGRATAKKLSKLQGKVSGGPKMYQLSDMLSGNGGKASSLSLGDRIKNGGVGTKGAFGKDYTYQRGGNKRGEINVDGEQPSSGRGGGRGRGRGGGRGGDTGRGRGRGGGSSDKNYNHGSRSGGRGGGRGSGGRGRGRF